MNVKLLRGEKSEPVVDETESWETAYLRFETPQQEIRKFKRRLIKLGIERCSRESAVVELFCGRGNGLEALAQLGFRHLEGVDISPRLVSRYNGPGVCYIGDCRRLPFSDCTKDILIVQGGLHHLTTLPEDLDQVLSEVHRVLRPNGRFIAVEPWLTAFLRIVHASCDSILCRRLSSKLDALALMIRYERKTYEQWLMAPEIINALFNKHFRRMHVSRGWGKLAFVGCPK